MDYKYTFDCQWNGHKYECKSVSAHQVTYTVCLSCGDMVITQSRIHDRGEAEQLFEDLEALMMEGDRLTLHETRSSIC